MNYPYVKCLNPRTIHNHYTHEDMVVPCGNCEVCAMRKSSMNTMRVQAESALHLHCRFITLTYDEIYVPRMMLVDNDMPDNPSKYMLVDPDTGIVLGHYESLEDYNFLCQKCESYDFPFLRKRDLQLFFKRLRKYFSDKEKKYNIPYGKIRYYACGEYGPKRFRPHYHIILWTSSDEVVSELGEAVYSCWKFGRVSTEIPRGDVSSYVAKYINSSVPLPSILKLPETKPFSVHSQHLGESFFQATREKVYESSYEDFTRASIFVNGTHRDISMWRSLKAYYFPRCKEFSVFNSQQRYAAYTIIKRAYKEYPQYKKESLVSLTERVLRDIKDFYELYGTVIPQPFLDECASYADIGFQILTDKESYESAFRSLYMIFRLSKHFLVFVCAGNWSMFSIKQGLTRIEEFWKQDELYHINNVYRQIEQSEEELFESEEEYLFRFSLNSEDVKKTRLYKKYKQERIKAYNDSMKHKILNDANRIFEQY